MGNRIDMAVLRRRRSLLPITSNRRTLALGVCDSIAFTSGRVPTSNRPRVLATLGGYFLCLVALTGFIAALARIAH